MCAPLWVSQQQETMKLDCLISCSQLKEKKMRKASILLLQNKQSKMEHK